MHLGFLKGVDLGTVASFLVNTLSVHADVKISAPLIILLTKKILLYPILIRPWKKKTSKKSLKTQNDHDIHAYESEHSCIMKSRKVLLCPLLAFD